MEHEENNYLDMYTDINDSFNISMYPPAVDEILACSDDIEISKSCYIDDLTSGICKDLLTLRPGYFASIFQSSLSTNIFPSLWSKGLVTVIPKPGDLSNPSNWRPISQTPLFAKILEKLVYNRMNNYFIEINILSTYQYGFRQGKSTQQAIFGLTKYIYSNLNHKKIVAAVCLDVSKAFDSINHSHLLHKMSKIGFCNNTLAWFKSYRTHTQSVQFDKKNLSRITSISRHRSGYHTRLDSFYVLYKWLIQKNCN